MAKEYLEKLSDLVERLKIEGETNLSVEVKHLFSGAALYVNRVICASWSPGGIAFKLTLDEVDRLINSGKSKPLKYFDKGYTKKGYAMFEATEVSESSHWKAYFRKAIKQVTSEE